MLDWILLSGTHAIAVAAVGILGGGGLLMWGLWGDRGRGKRRCPRCWHDLSRTEGMTCGECGFIAANEAKLHRPRRRFAVAGLGVLAILLGAGAAESLGSGRDLWRLVPDRALVFALPWTAGPGGPDSLHTELRRRIGSGTFATGALEALVESLVVGDSEAPVGSPAWEAKYASLRSSGMLGMLADRPDLRARLREIPPRIEVTMASPWPEDLPAYATLDLRHWWADPVQLRTRVDSPDAPELGEVAIGFDTRGFAWRRGWSRFPLEFSAPLPEGETITLRVRVDRREPLDEAVEPLGVSDLDDTPPRSLEWGAWIEVPEFQQTVSCPIERRESIAERLEPVDDPALQAAIAEAFAPGLVVREAGPRPWAMRFDPIRTFRSEFDGLALGFEIEVREGDEVRRRTWMWWAAGPRGGPAEWRISWEDSEGLAAATDHDPEEGRWTLRIRGDRELAMRAIETVRAEGGAPENFTRWWSGEIEVPLRVRRIPGSFPPRRWFNPASHEQDR